MNIKVHIYQRDFNSLHKREKTLTIKQFQEDEEKIIKEVCVVDVSMDS
jgi:hypothetical protein